MTAQLNKELQKMWSEKGKTCISIILPLHDLTRDRKPDKLHLQKAIKLAGDQLLKTNDPDAEKLIKSMNDIYYEMKFDHYLEGIGLFISANVRYYTFFPFPVTKKIVVNKSFVWMDLLYNLQLSIPYFVLDIDENRARLYYGKTKKLEEIKTDDFPLIYDDTYDYSSSLGISLNAETDAPKEYVKDTYSLKKVRFENFLQQVDEQLFDYVKEGEVIILCGIKANTSAFINRSLHAGKIINIVNSPFESYTQKELASIAWKAIEAYTKEKLLYEISEYKEKEGEGLSEHDIVQIWQAVEEGRGVTLLVEKDFWIEGYIQKQNPYILYLHHPKPPYILFPDAINQLIQMMIDKNGKVIILNKGMLKTPLPIGLITRF
jgi:hypothetical protein